MRYCLVLLALLGLPAAAQTPTQALAQQWDTICATAVNGTELFVRCDETASSSDPNANLTAAAGQRLEEIPGQARTATRDTELQPGEFRTEVGDRTHLTWRGNPLQGVMLGLESGLAAHWSVFASLASGRLDRRRSPNEAAFNADTVNATVGVNFQPGARWLIGLSASNDRENLDYRDSDGSTKTRYNGLIAMTSFNANAAWTFDAYSGRLQGNFDLVRALHYSLPVIGGGTVIVDALAFASPDSRRSLSGAASNWNWSHAAWQGEISLGYDLSSTRIDPYTETGGDGLALEVPGRTVKTQRSRVDIRMGRTISSGWGVWQPSLRLGWRQEFGNPSRRVTLGLAEDRLDNPISFDTEDPDRGWGELGVGSVFTFLRGKSAFIEYRQRFAHSFLSERVLALGLRVELP